MKRKVTRRKQKKPSDISRVEMKNKITHSFAQQIVTFIRRYRPALEALAKR
jgi:hypothetical protein